MIGRRIIERRIRVFLGCEGESEQGYCAFLQRLANEYGRAVHLRQVNLQPAGDPLALCEKVVKTFALEEKRGAFAAKIVLLDSDKLADQVDRGRRAIELLMREGFIAIWQRPDHEGFLLRHFAGHDRDDPPRGRSMAVLQTVWPDYQKNMSAADLKKMLSLTDVQRAAAVIPELRQLLDAIGIA
jgi:hypothetical protein